jgi:uncharacterized protein YjiS (DUF1127 family)
MISVALPHPPTRSGPGTLRDLWVALRRWRLRSRGRQLLLGFDEHTLRDLGICPAHAEFEGRKPFWRN